MKITLLTIVGSCETYRGGTTVDMRFRAQASCLPAFVDDVPFNRVQNTVEEVRSTFQGEVVSWSVSRVGLMGCER